MVRVRWRSATCDACYRRKVKCDKTAPECRGCRRSGVTCERSYQLGNSVNIPRLPEPTTTRAASPSRSSMSDVATRSSSGDRRVHLSPHRQLCDTPPPRLRSKPDSHPSRTGATNKRLEAYRDQRLMASMDTRIEPNLSRQARTIQEHELFYWFVADNFPVLFACYAPRMDVTWLDYVLHPPHPPPRFLELAVGSISTLCAGQARRQRELINTGQRYYGAAVHTLMNNLIPYKPSHDPLAAALLLAIFEMKNGESHTSWLPHAKGVEAIMRDNGPGTYSSGFARTLFLTFRPFLIRAALLEGKPCFLEREEWTSMVEKTVDKESRSGRGSVFTAQIEHAFNLIVKAPGLIARARTAPLEALTSLEAETSSLTCRLGTIEQKLSNGLSSMRDPRPDAHEIADYLGPIQVDHAIEIARLSCSGIRATLQLLQSRWYHQPPENAVHLAPMHTMSPDHDTASISHMVAGLSYGIAQERGWLDRCALSMGVAPVRGSIEEIS